MEHGKKGWFSYGGITARFRDVGVYSMLESLDF